MSHPLRSLAWLAVTGAILAAAAFYPVTKPAPMEPPAAPAPAAPEALASLSDAAPTQPLDLLFIHHSVGGQWLAEEGREAGLKGTTIYKTHPNGGGLRKQLEAAGYRVHEASYRSKLGERTDLFDWLPKFHGEMPQILSTAEQDAQLSQGRNRVVMFKSCFPNSFFRKDKTLVGSASGPDLTLSNAQATFMALREEFAKQPDILFVYVTAPPLLARETREPLFKFIAKKLLGRETNDVEQVHAAATAREFNNWVGSPEGWLKGYPGRNLVVFDYYDLLTGGESNFLLYPSNGGKDDHPSAEGQRLATTKLVPFLNRAVRYAGIAG